MKRIKFIANFFMATMLCVNLSSCGDDSDGLSSNPLSTLTDINGERVKLTSVGGICFGYDENGNLESVSDSDETYYIEGNKIDMNYEGEDGAYNINFSLNAAGFITKINMSCDLKYGSYYDKQNFTYTFEYDSNGQMIKTKANGSGKWNYGDGDSGSAEAEGTGKLTWLDGKLIKYESEGVTSGYEDGEQYNDVEKVIVNYEYGTLANPIRQNPVAISDMCNGEMFSFFGCVGLFGVGPAYFPVSCSQTFTGDWPEYNNYNFSYILNDNGTIRVEYYNNRPIYYYYESQMADEQSVKSAKGVLPMLKSAFKSFRDTKNLKFN